MKTNTAEDKINFLRRMYNLNHCYYSDVKDDLDTHSVKELKQWMKYLEQDKTCNNKSLMIYILNELIGCYCYNLIDEEKLSKNTIKLK